jgi:hypothetical protein
VTLILNCRIARYVEAISKTLGENRLCSLRPLFREYLFFWLIVAFVVLGSVCSVPPRRVSYYPGTDAIMGENIALTIAIVGKEAHLGVARSVRNLVLR